ncbi:MAG: DUF3560 domain-containing protein [Alphaproteobacteria bacterium]
MDATYSPDDNKLRLYAGGRLDTETFARVKAAGFRWAPRQELFVAPMWTPGREDLLIELCGDIGDDDSSLAERAEERADAFDGYQANRRRDSQQASEAVSAIADGIPMGQPILVGHHSEKHARRDAAKIERGMAKAVKMWETAEYWKRRAAGALRNADYKERPDVRARRIKRIEKDQRKSNKDRALCVKWLALWSRDGLTLEQATAIANHHQCYLSFPPKEGANWGDSAWQVLSAEGAGAAEVARCVEKAKRSYPSTIAWCDRWLTHYANRLEYERAMLGASGGTLAEKRGTEQGGAVQCWASRGSLWAYIVKVNKVSVSILRNFHPGQKPFRQTMAFDKLEAIMSAAEVAQAKADGRAIADADGIGFFLLEKAPTSTPKPEPEPSRPCDTTQADDGAASIEAMREQLKTGVQVVTAPQLFVTPKDLAKRVVMLAGIEAGQSVLEPSAGTGALIDPIAAAFCGFDCGRLVMVEVNCALAGQLRETRNKWAHANESNFCIENADFLECNGNLGTFDRIVMNPPFANGADIKHIRHAQKFLKPGGRLVAICANGPRQRAAFMDIAEHWEDLPAGTFKQAGTNVNTALVVLTAGD